MEHVANLFGNVRKPAPKRKQSERGDILDTILARLNPSRQKGGFKQMTHGRLAYLLEGIPTKDLYALISKCDDAERRGYPWSAIFWKEIRPYQPK